MFRRKAHGAAHSAANGLADASASPKTIPTNWPLITGVFLVLLVSFLAFFGPALAPKDPREQKLIIQLDGTWLTPPYPAFTPGYPLGSDNLGRDLFSWLLWSVRPTMILVIIVALLRLMLGLFIGIGAGWSDRWAGRLCDGMISAALAVPSLIAGLIVITAVGFRLGVWAFVLGLAVTGWAETAQLVREQTRTVRGQEAVEAARALGASGGQILFLHILPQVMPMIWMLLAFEISNTLVTTAGLGFLGYYLGGAVFVEVEDFVYQRISGMPELGQMLATAWMVLDEPWAMVAAGTVVFFIVLAFNLVGEGLQQRLARHLGGPRKFYTRVAGEILPWFDARVMLPLETLSQRRGFRVAAILALVVVLAGSGLWWRVQHPPATPAAVVETQAPDGSTGTDGDTASVTHVEETVTSTPPPASALAAPGGHIYANEGRDPWQTRWLGFDGPITPTVQWEFESEGFTGGPAIDAAGTLYVAAKDGKVYALDGAGAVQWETTVGARPVGNPALAADGTLYVADKLGLNALSPGGDVLWHFAPDDGKTPTGGPVVGPDGTVYLKSLSGLLAVTADGGLKWQTTFTETHSAMVPRLSPDGAVVFWEDAAFNAADGSPYDWGDIFAPHEGAFAQVIVAPGGELYRRFDQTVTRLLPVTATNEEAILFDGTIHDIFGTQEVGLTPDNRPWVAARISFGMGFFWFSGDGLTAEETRLMRASNLLVAGVDRQHTAFVCFDSYESFSQCWAIGADSERPFWREQLPGTKAIAGVAMAPGRLYVATWEGKLFALGDADAAPGVAEGIEGGATTPPVVDPGPAWDRPVVPGDHPWPMENRDPWGTLWTPFTGPQQAAVRWSIQTDGGFVGGPAVAVDGTVYVTTALGDLLAFAPDGTQLWKATLPGGALSGGPALAADGTIYVTDGGGNLTAFTPDGEIVWRYHATGIAYRPLRGDVTQPMPLEGAGPASTGPIVDPDGNILFGLAIDMGNSFGNPFIRAEVMQAVSPDGVSLLEEPPFIFSDRVAPRLLLDTGVVMWGGDFVYAPEPLREAYYGYLDAVRGNNESLRVGTFSGADGRAYTGYLRTLESWFLTDAGTGVSRTFTWAPEDSPGSAGLVGATPDGLAWMFFRSGKFVWVDADDVVTGPVRFPLESRLVAVDVDATAYGCGSSMGRTPACMGYAMGTPDPLWHIVLEGGDKFAGAALAPGVMYATTENGYLYALGD